MRKQIFATLAVVGTIAATLAVISNKNMNAPSTNFLQDSNWLDEQFARYISRYGKSYGTKEEYLYRRSLFEKQLEIVSAANSRNDVTYRVGLNQFSDLSDQEFSSRYLGDSGKEEPDAPLTNNIKLAQAPVISPIDWREKGVVGAVKDQGHCGSCWSFSTAGPVEENYAIKYGKQIVLSEQQLVDCSWDYGNNGCNGGLFAQGYQYV
jgi:C1A family cysteine protease